jgi:hypothetical protein
MKKTIILIPVIFVVVLFISVGLRVILSPDFEGFGKNSMSSESTHLSGSDGQSGSTSTSFNWKKQPVLIIGDSLTQGAKKEIEKAVGKNASVDGLTNRTMADGLAMLKEKEANGVLKDNTIIVIALAHNITGTTVEDAQQIVEMIRPGQSLIMMTGHGNSYMDPINEYIRSLPRAYSYIAVADWDMTIAQSPSLLADDNVHINGKQGNELYADLILRALEVARPMP